MNWDEASKTKKTQKHISNLDVAVWALIGLLFLLAIMRFTFWSPKANNPIAEIQKTSHIKQYVGDLSLKHGELLVQQHVTLFSTETKGYRGLSTYMPKPPIGDPYDFEVELGLLGQSVLDSQPKQARSGEYVTSRSEQIILPGDTTFTLIYRAKNIIRSDGKENIILWPASSLWKLTLLQQIYRIHIPKELTISTLRVLQKNEAGELVEWAADSPNKPQVSESEDEQAKHYSIQILEPLLPGKEVFLDLRFPMSDLAINQGRALEAKGAWEKNEESGDTAREQKENEQ